MHHTTYKHECHMAKIGYFQLQHPTGNGDSQAQILKV